MLLPFCCLANGKSCREAEKAVPAGRIPRRMRRGKRLIYMNISSATKMARSLLRGTHKFDG
jgi:hypothetical protein